MEFQGQTNNPANRVDEHGNPFPLAGHGDMGGAHAAHGTGGGQFQPSREEHKTGGILHRSGSSSSSSSSDEDDGMGGRRKKGMKEKIKEKLPGGHKDNQQHMATGTGGAYGQHRAAGTDAYGQQGHAGAGMTGTGTGTGEKKGLMDKIKEKLPGQH